LTSGGGGGGGGDDGRSFCINRETNSHTVTAADCEVIKANCNSDGAFSRDLKSPKLAFQAATHIGRLRSSIAHSPLSTHQRYGARLRD